MQLYPYGWRLPSGKTVRGMTYREIVKANEGSYLEWSNPHAERAYFRKTDFKQVK